jgi:hypothetical protein
LLLVRTYPISVGQWRKQKAQEKAGEVQILLPGGNGSGGKEDSEMSNDSIPMEFREQQKTYYSLDQQQEDDLQSVGYTVLPQVGKVTIQDKSENGTNEIGCIGVMSGPIVPNSQLSPRPPFPEPSVNTGSLDNEKVKEDEPWTVAWIIRYVLMILITVGSSVLSGLLGMGV